MFSELIGHVKSAANSVGSFVKANPVATAAAAAGAVALGAAAVYAGGGGTLTQLAQGGADLLSKASVSAPSTNQMLQGSASILGGGWDLFARDGLYGMGL